MKKFFFIFCSSGILLAACNTEPAVTASTTVAFSLDSAKTAIATSNALYEESIRTGDSAKFIGCYTSDGCINAPNMPRMCGQEALAGFFKGAASMGIKDLKLTTEDVMGGPDVVSETGAYEMLAEGGKSIEKGKYIVLWKQENGAWKMYRDEWNSDTAPAPVAKK